VKSAQEKADLLLTNSENNKKRKKVYKERSTRKKEKEAHEYQKKAQLRDEALGTYAPGVPLKARKLQVFSSPDEQLFLGESLKRSADSKSPVQKRSRSSSHDTSDDEPLSQLKKKRRSRSRDSREKDSSSDDELHPKPK
jgi:hypothetical protein